MPEDATMPSRLQRGMLPFALILFAAGLAAVLVLADRREPSAGAGDPWPRAVSAARHARGEHAQDSSAASQRPSLLAVRAYDAPALPLVPERSILGD